MQETNEIFNELLISRDPIDRIDLTFFILKISEANYLSLLSYFRLLKVN